MREIEVKARVQDMGSLRAVLLQKGMTLSDPVRQHDIVWGRPGITGDNTEPWLRLRSETKGGETRHIFTLKRSVTSQLDNIEHETEVKDPNELAQIVEQLDFVRYTDITKTRQKVVVGDVELCLDSVDDLGDFIEAEKLTDDDADQQGVMQSLWELLESFGVHRADEVLDGYDTLMARKLGKE